VRASSRAFSTARVARRRRSRCRNASCGALSIFACLSYIDDARSRQIWAAFVLPVAALVLDFFDGYVARLSRRRQSLLGADLDSLADIVSFGVAPAVLGYTLGLRGLWDVLCLTYFICCGISRLARFNVTSADLTNVATGKVRTPDLGGTATTAQMADAIVREI